MCRKVKKENAWASADYAKLVNGCFYNPLSMMRALNTFSKLALFLMLG